MYRILNAITKYAKSNPIRLHMPNHKGRGKLASLFGANFDVTELSKIDNENVVKEAEKDIAKLYNAKSCFIGSDGSSLFIIACIYILKNFGKKIVIERSSHKSVFNGLKIANLEPVILEDNFLDGLPKIPTATEIENVIKLDKEIGAILLTCPDYYGRVCDIENIAKICHKYNKLLVLDSAHGSNLFGIKKAPCEYTDISVLSAHKELETLNQGSYIIVNNSAIIDMLKSSISMFTTTSPSYPILASVEYGIKRNFEKKDYTKIIEKIVKLKEKLNALNVKCLDSYDPYKLCVDFGGSNYDIKYVNKELEKNKIFAELVTDRYILFMFSYNNKVSEIDKLFSVIKCLKKSTKKIVQNELKIGNKKMGYLESVNSKKESIKIEKAENRISAENVGITPPCYPVIVAGEVITKENIKLLQIAPYTFNIIDGKIDVVKE